MCPIYAVLAAPLARSLGVPVLLWYTHWRASRLLRAADRASSVVLSVDRRSFPLPSGKVRAIGHGIDQAEFSCGRASSGDGTLRLLAVGRYSPAKGLEAIMCGLRLAVDGGLDATLDVRGPTLSPLEREHRSRLEHVAGELELRERVRLGDAVDRSELPALFAQHDTLVNNMRPGAADKVVYEAGASCLPVLASSPVFDSLLEDRFRFPTDDVAALADRLRGLAALDEAARVEVGRAMHARVAQGHSVEHWAEQVWAAGRR
jgi:glycosyltransferase involved in cell wall biosynthesis